MVAYHLQLATRFIIELIFSTLRLAREEEISSSATPTTKARYVVMAMKHMALCVLLCMVMSSSLRTTEARSTKERASLVYYVHEVRTGANATILAAAGPGMGKWGSVMVNDNVVRWGESPASTLIGGSTGFGVLTSQLGITGGILSVSKVTFNDASKYNASTLTLIVTVATPSPPYEALVLGGTGHFRGVHGYALATPGVASPPVYPTKWELFLSKY